MLQKKVPRSCFGLYYSEEAEECGKCSIRNLCRNVTHGVLSWGVAAAYIAQYNPQTPAEAIERDILLSHINYQIAKIGRRALRYLKEKESQKKKGVSFLDPDPSKVLADATAYYNIDLSFLPKTDIEVLEKMIASLYPLPLNKISIGGNPDAKQGEKYKKVSIHLSFGNGRVVINYLPSNMYATVLTTSAGLVGAVAVTKKEKVGKEFYEKLVKVKEDLIKAQGKVALTGNAE